MGLISDFSSRIKWSSNSTDDVVYVIGRQRDREVDGRVREADKREIERKRDRKSFRQTETDRKRDRRQTDIERTERQRNRETERQRDRKEIDRKIERQLDK
jgi:hypothetical protein